MISRLKKIAKRAVAVMATGIIVLTALPTIPVKAADALNYHMYQNAKQVYDSVPYKEKIYTTPDNAELFWVTKSNKASSTTHLRYRTLGWRFVISSGGKSMKCDLMLDRSITKPMGEYESGGYYYILYAIDLKTVYNRMNAQNSSLAGTIYGGSSYHILAHPIMTTVPANSSPKGSLTGENSNGTVNTSGAVYFMDEDGGYNGIKNVASWSSASYTAFNDFHIGRSCDIDTMKYKIMYKIIDQNGNAVKNTGLSSGLKTNAGGGVVNSNGSAYAQNVTSFAPVGTLNVDINKPGYIIDKTWKKANSNLSVKMGDKVTSYSLGGSVTLIAKVTPITYYVEYYKDGQQITRQQATYDKSFNILNGASISWNGYTFKNWNTDPNGKGTTYNSNQSVKNLTNVANNTIKLYAQKEPKEYEVTLNPVGGTGGTAKVYEKYGVKYTAQSEKMVNNPASISSVTSPKKFGYDFAGYFTSTNGYGTQFTDPGTLMLSPNRNQTVNIVGSNTMFDDNNSHTVYANYVPRTPVITFDKQGGTGGSTDTKATFGQDLPSKETNGSALQAPVREGWSFKGYYTQPDGKGDCLYNEAMGPLKTCDFEDNITAYAYWVDNIPPTVTVVPSTDGWTNKAITITVRMQDKGSGLKKSECKVFMDGEEASWTKTFSDGTTTQVTATFTCKTEGIHRYEAVAVDMWGNKSTAQTVVYYDCTAPRGSVDVSGPGVSESTSLRDLKEGTRWYFKNGKVTDYNTK